MSKPALIGDSVKAATGGPFLYEGQSGVVLASRKTTDDIVEHQIRFPPRKYTQEEMDRGEDTFPDENTCWLRETEIKR